MLHMLPFLSYQPSWLQTSQSLNVWATEVHIIVAAAMLRAAIYVLAPSGGTYKCLKHSLCEVMKEDCIRMNSFLSPNIDNHFEIVKKM